jgi:hypothetical protein
MSEGTLASRAESLYTEPNCYLSERATTNLFE